MAFYLVTRYSSCRRVRQSRWSELANLGLCGRIQIDVVLYILAHKSRLQEVSKVSSKRWEDGRIERLLSSLQGHLLPTSVRAFFRSVYVDRVSWIMNALLNLTITCVSCDLHSVRHPNGL